jgi:hypothetical protein
MQNERYRREEWTAMQSRSSIPSMNISLLIAGRRGVRGKRGHKETTVPSNISSVTEANQSSHSKGNADRRRRKRSTIEMEGLKPLHLRLEQVKEPQSTAMKMSDQRSVRSQIKTEIEHPRYVVEVTGHQTVHFKKEARWQKRRRTREKEALKTTKQKLKKHGLEVDGHQAERLEEEEKRQQKRSDFGSAEPEALYLKKKMERLRKQRSK